MMLCSINVRGLTFFLNKPGLRLTGSDLPAVLVNESVKDGVGGRLHSYHSLVETIIPDPFPSVLFDKTDNNRMLNTQHPTMAALREPMAQPMPQPMGEQMAACGDRQMMLPGYMQFACRKCCLDGRRSSSLKPKHPSSIASEHEA
jgi:hypothetical protein